MSQLSPSCKPQLYFPCIPHNERLPLTFLLNKWIYLVRQKAAVSLHCLVEEQLVICCSTRISSTSWLCHTHQSKAIPASVNIKELGHLFKQSTLLLATRHLLPLLWNLISQTRAIQLRFLSFFFFPLLYGCSWWNKKDQALAECFFPWSCLWLVLSWLVLSCFVYGSSCNHCYI